MIIPWVEKVGYIFVADANCSCVVSCSSCLVLQEFIRSKFDPKKHQAALLIKYKDSKFALLIMGLSDVPMENIYDPLTGKLLLLYSPIDVGNALARIS